MLRPWYDKDPARYEKVRGEVELAYPELRFVRRGRSVVAIGRYPLFDRARLIDRYQIEVELPNESETGLPTVREVGNRIPRVADRHMEPDGKTCVVLPDAFWYEYPDGMSLLEFLNGPVRRFFANQSLLEMGRNDVWQGGEWSHGAAGIIEFYEPLMGTADREIIREYLSMLKNAVIKGHWSCPCRSGKILRHCHLELVRELHTRIPSSVAAMSEARLKPPSSASSAPRAQYSQTRS